MANNHFEWKGSKRLIGGYIWVGLDERGLPILNIEVDDDFYSGVIDSKTLMNLLNLISLTAVEGKQRRLKDGG